MNARGGQSLVAEHTGAVRRSERHDDHLAAPDRPDVAANLFDDSDCFMAHTLTFDVRSTIVWPKIATADAGAGDADHGISRFDDGGVRNVLDPDVAGLVHDGCAHVISPQNCGNLIC